MNYLRGAQGFDEQFNVQFDKLCRNTIDRESIETGTTMDPAWEALKNLVGNRVLQLHISSWLFCVLCFVFCGFYFFSPLN